MILGAICKGRENCVETKTTTPYPHKKRVECCIKAKEWYTPVPNLFSVVCYHIIPENNASERDNRQEDIP